MRNLTSMRKRQESLAIAVFLLPALTLMLVQVVYAIFDAFRLSLFVVI